jgi:hypothetical protein
MPISILVFDHGVSVDEVEGVIHVAHKPDALGTFVWPIMRHNVRNFFAAAVLSCYPADVALNQRSSTVIPTPTAYLQTAMSSPAWTRLMTRWPRNTSVYLGGLRYRSTWKSRSWIALFERLHPRFLQAAPRWNTLDGRSIADCASMFQDSSDKKRRMSGHKQAELLRKLGWHPWGEIEENPIHGGTRKQINSYQRRARSFPVAASLRELQSSTALLYLPVEWPLHPGAAAARTQTKPRKIAKVAQVDRTTVLQEDNSLLEVLWVERAVYFGMWLEWLCLPAPTTSAGLHRWQALLWTDVDSLQCHIIACMTTDRPQAGLTSTVDILDDVIHQRGLPTSRIEEEKVWPDYWLQGREAVRLALPSCLPPCFATMIPSGSNAPDLYTTLQQARITRSLAYGCAMDGDHCVGVSECEWHAWYVQLEEGMLQPHQPMMRDPILCTLMSGWVLGTNRCLVANPRWFEHARLAADLVASMWSRVQPMLIRKPASDWSLSSYVAVAMAEQSITARTFRYRFHPRASALSPHPSLRESLFWSDTVRQQRGLPPRTSA